LRSHHIDEDREVTAKAGKASTYARGTTEDCYSKICL
jgi:hypothetical protein